MAIDGTFIKQNISKNIVKYREKMGYSQKELAKQLGVTPSRISNWEQGANCPTIDILFEVCKILHVSINDIYGVYPDSNVTLTYIESEHIKKYRKLDTHGKDMVDTVLQKEYDRIVELHNSTPALEETIKEPDNIITIDPLSTQRMEEELLPDAANDRNATEEEKKHADGIMFDDSEWE